jgi:two-component system chemotaxis response regulator CheY
MTMKKLKSLVAEDDLTSRTLLQSFLARYGECDIAVDGQQAVEAVKAARDKNAPYDLVCMDLRMPVMDGQQALREIRRQEATSRSVQTVKIIVTTAHSDMESITSALLGRCDSYLVKPIDTAKLLTELKTLGLAE